MYFTDEENRDIHQRIRTLEEDTGVELLAAVVDKCDHYPEIPWKAFALGVALSALIMLLQTVLRPDWLTAYAVLIHGVVVLGTGTAAALLTMVWPGWARCLLARTRAEGEMRQYAQALFLEQEMFGLPDRGGILLVIGLFEHQVVILPDRGVVSRLADGALETAIGAMIPALKRGNLKKALDEGIAILEAQLKASGLVSRKDRSDRIPEALIEKKGGADA